MLNWLKRMWEKGREKPLDPNYIPPIYRGYSPRHAK